MKNLKLIFSLFLITIYVTVSKCLTDEVNILTNIFDKDPEFSKLVDKANENFQIKLRNAFIEPSVLKSGRAEALNRVKIDNAIFNNNNFDILLQDIYLVYQKPVLDFIEPDLKSQLLKSSAHWNVVFFSGSYEITSNKEMNVFNSSNGKFIIDVNNIIAKGLSGIEFIDQYAKTTTFRLKFTINKVKVQFNEISPSFVGNDLNAIFMKYFERDLLFNLENDLRNVLDTHLRSYTLPSIFNGNVQQSASYRSLALRNKVNTDNLVENIFKLWKKILIDNNKNIVNIPNINETFKKEFGGIIFKGTFITTSGSLKDIATIKRIGSFSIEHFEDSFRLFGSFGFEELSVNIDHYSAKIWIIGPSGKITATIGKNTVYVDLNCKWIGLNKYYINNYNIKIKELDDIKVKVTGLGTELNWLFSKIVTWVVNRFKSILIKPIEVNLRAVIDKQLKTTNNILFL